MKTLFKIVNTKINSNMLRQWKVINKTRVFDIEYKCQEKNKLKPKSKKLPKYRNKRHCSIMRVYNIKKSISCMN